MSGNASAYWRVAGMSYLKYSSLCADMVRAALKEPHKAAAKARETVYFKTTIWKDGIPEKQGPIHSLPRPPLPPLLCSDHRHPRGSRARHREQLGFYALFEINAIAQVSSVQHIFFVLLPLLPHRSITIIALSERT